MDLFSSQLEKYLPSVHLYLDESSYGKILSGVKYAAAGIMICALIRKFGRYLAEKRQSSDSEQTEPETSERTTLLQVNFSNINNEDSSSSGLSEDPVVQKGLNGLINELDVEKKLQEQARSIVIDALTKAQGVVDSNQERIILDRLIYETKVTCTPHQQANNILTDAMSQLTVTS